MALPNFSVSYDRVYVQFCCCLLGQYKRPSGSAMDKAWAKNWSGYLYITRNDLAD